MSVNSMQSNDLLLYFYLKNDVFILGIDIVSAAQDTKKYLSKLPYSSFIISSFAHAAQSPSSIAAWNHGNKYLSTAAVRIVGRLCAAERDE